MRFLCSALLPSNTLVSGSRRVDILGVVCNTGRDACIVGVDIVNTYYGRADTPIGAFKGRFGSYTDNGQDSHYVNELQRRFPHTVHSRNDVPSALDIYRAALQRAHNQAPQPTPL